MDWKDPEAKKAYHKAYYESHRLEILKRSSEYYNENVEKVREYDKKYRAEHKKEYQEKNQRYKSDHKEELAKKKKEYYDIPENREARKQYLQKYVIARGDDLKETHRVQCKERRIRYRLQHPESLKGKMFGDRNPMKRPDVRAKVSKANMGKRCGEKSSNWKGGISFEPYCPKFNADLKRRIRAFFDHRCIICGKTTEENGKRLNCHHVEYNKQACCDGKPVRFSTLCERCHGKTNFGRDGWEAMLHRIIDEIYDGRSYFTKEEWEKLTES